jgi:hypothetical protein
MTLCPEGGGRNLRSWVARQRSVRFRVDVPLDAPTAVPDLY